MVSYVVMTVFERPSWCLKLIDCKGQENLCEKGEDIKKLADFDPLKCNNQKETYSNSNLPKLPQAFTLLYELFCLCTLWVFQRIRNKYKGHDDSSRIS